MDNRLAGAEVANREHTSLRRTPDTVQRAAWHPLKGSPAPDFGCAMHEEVWLEVARHSCQSIGSRGRACSASSSAASMAISSPDVGWQFSDVVDGHWSVPARLWQSIKHPIAGHTPGAAGKLHFDVRQGLPVQCCPRLLCVTCQAFMDRAQSIAVEADVQN